MAITNVDLHFLKYAQLQGQTSEFSKKKRGAVIAKGNKIISTGVNSHLESKHSIFNESERYVATINAEIVALGGAVQKSAPIVQCTMYSSDEPNWVTFKTCVVMGIKRFVHYGQTKSKRIKAYAQNLGVEIIGLGT